MTNASKPLYHRGYKTHEWNGSLLKRRVTIAGLVEKTDQGTSIKIGIAECCDKDQFVKEVGRRISVGRAIKKPEHIITHPKNPGKDFSEWCRNFCDEKDTFTRLLNP